MLAADPSGPDVFARMLGVAGIVLGLASIAREWWTSGSRVKVKVAAAKVVQGASSTMINFTRVHVTAKRGAASVENVWFSRPLKRRHWYSRAKPGTVHPPRTMEDPFAGHSGPAIDKMRDDFSNPPRHYLLTTHEGRVWTFARRGEPEEVQQKVPMIVRVDLGSGRRISKKCRVTLN